MLLDTEQITNALDAIINSDTPLYEQTIDTILALAFLPGFTIHESHIVKGYYELTLNFSWAPGLSTDNIPETKKDVDLNRLEVLLLLLASLSSPLSYTEEEIKQEGNHALKWVDYITKKGKYSVVLFLSLFNVALRYDPVGWGVPYNYRFSTVTPENLMGVSIQILSILFNYKVQPISQPPQYQQVFSDEFEVDDQQQVTENHLILLMKHLTLSEKDSKYLFDGLLRILENPSIAAKTLLPNAARVVDVYQETLVLLWLIISTNRDFVKTIANLPNVADLVYSITYIMHEGRKLSNSQSTTQLCSFILLYLSGERDICVNLNTRIKKKNFGDLPEFAGTYYDYIILALSDLYLETERGENDPLEECILTIFANFSAYIKSTCMLSAEKLIRIFEVVVEKYAKSNVSNKSLVLILDVFNNMLQYQFDGNIRVACCMLEVKDKFIKLDGTIPLKLSEKIKQKKGQVEVAENAKEVKPFQLSLATIMRFIKGVSGRISQFHDNRTKVLAYLSRITVVGMLPTPHALTIKHYVAEESSLHWLYNIMWGYIYLSHSSEGGMFKLKTLKLFKAVNIEENNGDVETPKEESIRNDPTDDVVEESDDEENVINPGNDVAAEDEKEIVIEEDKEDIVEEDSVEENKEKVSNEEVEVIIEEDNVEENDEVEKEEVEEHNVEENDEVEKEEVVKEEKEDIEAEEKVEVVQEENPNDEEEVVEEVSLE